MNCSFFQLEIILKIKPEVTQELMCQNEPSENMIVNEIVGLQQLDTEKHGICSDFVIYSFVENNIFQYSNAMLSVIAVEEQLEEKIFFEIFPSCDECGADNLISKDFGYKHIKI